jgi:hypothetical protein
MLLRAGAAFSQNRKAEETNMANAALFIGWGEAKAGREAQAFELFGHALGFWNRMQAEHKIKSFEPVMLQPHGGDLMGFMLVRGEQAKLDAVRSGDEFLEIEARSLLYIEHMGVISARINEGLQRAMQIWQKHIPAR